MNYEDIYSKQTRMYKEVNSVALLNKLQSTLFCYYINLNNYSINTIGQGTSKIRDFYYKTNMKLLNYIDELRKSIKLKNGYPIISLNDIDNISSIKTVASMDYSYIDALESIYKQINSLYNTLGQCINSLKEENDFYNLYLISSIKRELQEVNFYLI